MPQLKSIPIALTIAGSDSGGGAGVQADLKTFTALGCHGTTAITSVTAQNPAGVVGIEAISPNLVRKQIEAVFAELPPRAVKTGMLFSAEIIRTVADFFTHGKRPPLIVDPVMVATSGAVLLKPSAIRALKNELLPLATLVTPNLDEAEMLTGRKLKSLDDLLGAAEEIQNIRLRRARQGRASQTRRRRGGRFVRWEKIHDLESAPRERRFNTRHRLHLLSGDCGAPCWRRIVATLSRISQAVHHTRHRP